MNSSFFHRVLSIFWRITTCCYLVLVDTFEDSSVRVCRELGEFRLFVEAMPGVLVSDVEILKAA